MFDMNNMKLPLPNPEDWRDRLGASLELDVSERTVERYARAGTLTGYKIGRALLFWAPEVARLAQARQLVGRAVGNPET
jgi:hypothetical protein